MTTKPKEKTKLERFIRKRLTKFSQQTKPKLKKGIKNFYGILGNVELTPVFLFFASWFLQFPHLTFITQFLASVGLYYTIKFLFSEVKQVIARKHN